MNTRSSSHHAVLIALAIGAGLASMCALRAEDAGPSVLTPDALAKASGEEIYRHVCQACHMPNGEGATGAGLYPSLAGDQALGNYGYPVYVVVFGKRTMPPFGDMMSNDQVAAVVNYLRTHFGNDYVDKVTAEEVQAIRP